MPRKELFHTFLHLWKHPHSDRQRILAFQNRKIRHLIRHAYENVEYYGNLFGRTGIIPEDIRDARDIFKIPITDKNDLRAGLPYKILARKVHPGRLFSHMTSGSSGKPFVVRRAPLEEHIINMFAVRALRQLGKRLSDRTVRIKAAVIPGDTRETFLTHLRQTAGIHRAYTVDCLQPAEAICRQLEELAPDILAGYAGAVAHVAPLAEGKFRNKNLRYIFCGGESLTSAKRKIIEQCFGVRVFDMFGAHECNILAWECPETGLYHVCDDNVIVEVIRDGQPVREGEKGELVVTPLHAYAMPFIRYRMGDVVVKGPETCPCGQPFSTFSQIEGRTREYFTLPDGRRVHPLQAVLPVITEKAPWLNQFQMTQETKTRFVLRLSTLRKVASQDLEPLKKIVLEKLGQGAELEIALVDHIPFEKSGKFKDCRSLIEPDDDS